MSVGKVSIVITCYNLAPYIEQAIDSALVQAYPEVEVIVVNDGSTDNSLSILRQYTSRVVLINQRNQGLGLARNRGIAESGGEFFLPLDADDWISPDYLAKTAPLMADPRVGIVSTDMLYFGSRNDLIRTTGFSLEAEMASNQIPVTSLIRTAAFIQTPGYAQKGVACEDWNLWIDILKRGWQIAYVPEPLFHYRLREDSMSALSEGREAQKFEEIRRQHLELNWGSR